MLTDQSAKTPEERGQKRLELGRQSRKPYYDGWGLIHFSTNRGWQNQHEAIDFKATL